MTDKQPKMPEAGAIGRALTAAVDELREARGWSWRRVSAGLEAAGRPILPLGLTRMMRGERRTDVDELVALSLLFGVNPSALLFPRHADRDEPVELTPAFSQRADVVWDWADGRAPMPARQAGPGEPVTRTMAEVLDFTQHARPDMARYRSHPAVAAAEQLIAVILGSLNRPDGDDGPERIRRAFQRLGLEVDEMLGGDA